MNATQTIATAALADEIAAQYGITYRDALQAVETYLGQINAIDGTDFDETMDADAAEVIRLQVASDHGQDA